MEWESDERELKAVGAKPLPDGRSGLRIHGWEIESRKHSILTSLQLQHVLEDYQMKTAVVFNGRIALTRLIWLLWHQKNLFSFMMRSSYMRMNLLIMESHF